MKKFISLLLAAMMLASSLTAFAEAAQSTTDIIDFLPENPSEARPQDNMWAYVNWETIQNAEIPTGQPMWKVFVQIEEEIKADMNAIIDEIVANAGTYEAGTAEQKIADLYLCYVDEEGRNAAGLAPIQPYLDMIQNAADPQEYVEALVKINAELGWSSVISFGLGSDRYDNSKYSVSLRSMGLGGLGQSYLDDDTMSEYWDMYKKHVANLFVLTGVDEAEATAKAEAIFDLEKHMSANTLTRIERQNDPDLTYNLKTLDELQELFSNIDIEPLVAEYGFTAENGVNEYIVSDMKNATAVNELLTADNLQLLKDFSTLCILESMAYYLSMDFRAEDVRYGNEFKGITEQLSLEDAAKEDVQSTLSWNFGQIYAERFFPESSKQDVKEMVQEIIDMYHVRIDALTWMSEETKKGAHAKLDTMRVRIGYPDEGEWPTYLLDVQYKAPADGGNLAENIMNRSRASTAFSLSHLGQPVDKSQWGMTPQTVNASYSPSTNTITFPAGIIRGAFYDPNRSHAANLGGIGAVIGHEITHGFDNSGARYDSEGNMNLWWTDEDFAHFKELQEKVSAYYSAFEVWPGYYVNGDLTLGENIADLGSIACVTAIVGDDKEALQELFTAWASVWAAKMTRGELESRTRTDEHSVGFARVNAVCSTSEGFYKAFDVKEGDGMWVAPEDRVGIW